MAGRSKQESMPGLTSSAIEARLRPGAWSEGGFLGPEESLQAVLDEDAQTLARLGLVHETIALALQQVLSTAMERADADLQQGKLPSDAFPPNIADPRSLKPRIASPLSHHQLPSLDTGYLVGDIQVFSVHWRGLQACPWGCDAAGSRDFLLIHRASGEFVACPELLPHLIQEHHFFEGKHSPYRVEPDRFARVLHLSPPMQETKRTFWDRVQLSLRPFKAEERP